jgi:hypothetical protein
VNASALHALVDRVAEAESDAARLAALEDLSDAAAVLQARIEQADEPRETLSELSKRLGLD